MRPSLKRLCNHSIDVLVDALVNSIDKWDSHRSGCVIHESVDVLGVVLVDASVNCMEQCDRCDAVDVRCSSAWWMRLSGRLGGIRSTV